MINLRRFFNQNFITMKTKLLSVFVLLAGALVFSSCSKYEEGGPFLGSKKGILARDWEYDDYESMGDETHTSDQSGIDDYEELITFDKDGGFEREVSYKMGGSSFDYDEDGTWEFMDDKNFIRIVYEDNGGSPGGYYWKIIKLKKEELILENDFGGRITYVAD